MNKQTCENNIAVLMRIRDECKSQLDEGVLSDLDQIIAELKRHSDGSLSAAEAGRLSMRALQVVAVVVHVVTNIRDWLK